MQEITITTKQQYEVYDLTEQVHAIIKEHNITNGLCTIQALHATVGLFLSELEPNMKQDYSNVFPRLIPDIELAHDKIDGNARAHLLSALFGTNLHLIIKNGQLVIGTWQHVLFAEFDLPKERKLAVQFLPMFS